MSHNWRPSSKNIHAALATGVDLPCSCFLLAHVGSSKCVCLAGTAIKVCKPRLTWHGRLYSFCHSGCFLYLLISSSLQVAQAQLGGKTFNVFGSKFVKTCDISRTQDRGVSRPNNLLLFPVGACAVSSDATSWVLQKGGLLLDRSQVLAPLLLTVLSWVFLHISELSKSLTLEVSAEAESSVPAHLMITLPSVV